MADSDPNLHVAKQAAKMFTSQMSAAAVPPGVQLMTCELIAKAIFLHDVKPEQRLAMFDRWTKDIRDEIKASLKRKTNGKT